MQQLGNDSRSLLALPRRCQPRCSPAGFAPNRLMKSSCYHDCRRVLATDRFVLTLFHPNAYLNATVSAVETTMLFVALVMDH